MMPWRTHIAVAAIVAAIATPAAASGQTVEELQAENAQLRASLSEFQRYDAALANDYDTVTAIAGDLRRKVDLQAKTIRRLRARQSQVSSWDVAAVASMVMTPGGHGQLGPRGWVTAETGTTAAGSAAVRFRTGARGWRVRVWEDGSLRVWWRGHVVLTACIHGKGCED